MKNVFTASLDGAGKAMCAAPAGVLSPHCQVSVLILCAGTKRGGHTQAVPAQARNQRVRQPWSRNRCIRHDGR